MATEYEYEQELHESESWQIRAERERINHKQETFWAILGFLFLLFLGGCGLYIFS